MGVCWSDETEDTKINPEMEDRDGDKEKEKEKVVDKEKRDGKSKELEIRLCLIGQGECGKSTIFKQMRRIEASEQGREAFKQAERAKLRQAIYDNIVSQMQILIRSAFDEEMDFSSETVKDIAKALLQIPIEGDCSAIEIGGMIQKLWAEESLQFLYEERDRLFTIFDGSGYFWDNLERIYTKDYVPTEEDILRSRVKTIQTDETVFTYKDTRFRVTDVGGQRAQRRIWSDVINSSNAVLFMASLTEWDQQLREDRDRNRIVESFALFAEVAQESASSKVVILLLNKMDLFTQKIEGQRKKQFTACFPDFKGELTVKACSEYLRHRFMAMAGKKRKLFFHFVTAIEMDNVKLIWKDIRTMLVQQFISATVTLG